MCRIRPAIIVIAAFLACLLTGCMRIDRGVSLNTDGSGSYKVAAGFSDRLVQSGGTTFADQMDACGRKVTQEGGTSARVDDGTFTTWTFSWRFANTDALNTLLKRGTAFCQAPGASGTAAIASIDPVDVTEHTRLLTTTFVVRGHVSLIFSQDSVNLDDPAMASLFKDARTSFSITMPLWVTSHSSGGAVNGNTITYTAHQGDDKAFEVVGGGPSTMGIVAAFGALAAILLSVLILTQLVRLWR